MSDTKTNPRKSQIRLRGKPILTEFVWGQVIAVHSVGEYDIVEYVPNQSTNVADEDYDPSPKFHSYIDSRDTSHSYSSLDAALVGAIAIKRDGINTRADSYFIKATEAA